MNLLFTEQNMVELNYDNTVYSVIFAIVIFALEHLNCLALSGICPDTVLLKER